MLDKIPNDKEMTDLLGQPLYNVWTELCQLIDTKYDMDTLWNKGYREWVYEYKYRRGGRLFVLYLQRKIVLAL